MAKTYMILYLAVRKLAIRNNVRYSPEECSICRTGYRLVEDVGQYGLSIGDETCALAKVSEAEHREHKAGERQLYKGMNVMAPLTMD